jgi:putative ABC transport system permease protein
MEWDLVVVGGGAAGLSAARAGARRLPFWWVRDGADLRKCALAKEPSTLATLDLGGPSRTEIAGTAVVAALGIGLLSAFLVLERRREYAVLRTVGALTRQVLVPSAVEGVVTVAASLVFGLPIGIGMALLSTRVLTPVFTLPPPLLVIDEAGLLGLIGLVLLASAVSIVASLVAVARLPTAQVLHEG